MLLLGFLVSSAKASYDDQKHQVLEMAARVSVLDRLLALYGDGAVGARRDLRVAVRVSVARAWPQHGRSDLGTLALSGGMLETIEQLAPQSALQTEIRGQAVSLELDIAERRSLLVAQAQGASIPPLVVVVLWLIAILFGFSLIAPRSPVALLALLVAAASASGAIYLVLELHHPFDGLLRISSAPLTEALGLPPN
jgi:hypothetical protein